MKKNPKKKNLLKKFEDLTNHIKTILGDAVEKVVLSQRLKNSPYVVL